jgi:predicted TIM-barrel fold metal-dependent hydrolase
MVGNEPFMYSSDFPHEVNAATCKKELAELVENEGLSDHDKNVILQRNAAEFYGLKLD